VKSLRLALISLLIALTAIGAAIKIPAVIASVALDSFPALLAAALLGGPAGAAVGAFGHLLSAFLGGMPMGPFHGIIAIEMAILAFVFSLIYRRGNKRLAGMVFFLGNALAAPVPFIFFMGTSFYFSIVGSLMIGSAINTAIALVLIPRLAHLLKPILVKASAHR